MLVAEPHGDQGGILCIICSMTGGHFSEYSVYGRGPFLRLRKGQKGCIVGTRKQTIPDAAPDGSVSQQQQTAIDLIVAGRNLQETADAIGVQRPTVSHWLHHHCGFQAALNSRRQELWDGQVEALRGLLPRALAVLAKELEGDNPLPAAIQILKSCGLATGLGRPTGPTTVDDAERAQRQREMERISTAITAEDVALAERSRQQQRMFAELAL